MLDNIATPYSVNAYGRYLRFVPRTAFKITNCDLERSTSAQMSWNMKSTGNRFLLRATAWTSARGSTP